MQMIWLKAFVALAESKNFSEAADEIYVSQSSLSKYIQSLEKTVQFKLFDRSHRQVELTPAGVELYHYAVELVAKYDEMTLAMHDFVSEDRRKIQLTTVSAAHMFGYATLFYMFHKKNPTIDFSMRELEMLEAVRQLSSGDIDFAVVRTNLLPEAELQKYQEIRLNTEKVYLLCSTKHPFAQRDKVSLREVQKERMVMPNFGIDEIPMLFQRYRCPDIPLDIAVTSSRTEILTEYVKSMVGVELVSRPLGLKMIDAGGLVMIPIEEEPVMTLGVLALKGNMSPENRIFWEYMEDAVKNNVTADPEMSHLALYPTFGKNPNEPI